MLVSACKVVLTQQLCENIGTSHSVAVPAATNAPWPCVSSLAKFSLQGVDAAAQEARYSDHHHFQDSLRAPCGDQQQGNSLG